MIIRTGRYVIVFLLASVSILAGVILARNRDTTIEQILSLPDLLSKISLRKGRQNAGDDLETEPPLIRQARAFALYLKPSPLLKPNSILPDVTSAKGKETKQTQTAHPSLVTPRFQVLAITIYRNNPKRSMALIAEFGTEPRWIKRGQNVGHLLIEKIEKEQVVWRNGIQTGQVAVTVSPSANPVENTKRPITAVAKHMKVPASLLVEKQDSNALPSTPAPSEKRHRIPSRR